MIIKPTYNFFKKSINAKMLNNLRKGRKIEMITEKV